MRESCTTVATAAAAAAMITSHLKAQV